MTALALGAAAEALGAPKGLEATSTPEERGVPRDGVRLLVSGRSGVEHRRFGDLPDLLRSGDLLVVNRSETLPASLPASSSAGSFRVSASTFYGGGTWLVEPRWSFARPGPIPLRDGESFDLGGARARVVAHYPGIPRLLFVRVEGDLVERMYAVGAPIRYGYLERPAPLAMYQTVFAREPGSAEMPSAGRPFTGRTLERLAATGIHLAEVTLHAGVSSLAAEDVAGGGYPVLPEPFRVPAETAAAVNRARSAGRSVYAVGTTVLRALESAWTGTGLAPVAGFTRTIVAPGNYHRVVDGLISGLHDRGSSHLLLLEAVLGAGRLRQAYAAASEKGYLWHEFGDLHLAMYG